jgi:hypothetical protein
MHESMTEDPFPHRGRDELAVLMAYLDEIAAALTAREHALVERLLRRRMVSHLPRDIREELMVVVRQSSQGFRVAIEFLRYRHRLRQLALGGEELPQGQLELALGRGAGWDPPVGTGWRGRALLADAPEEEED